MKLFLFVSFLFLSGLSVLAQELNFQSTPKPGDKFCILTYRDPIEFEAYTKEFYQLENGFENKKGIDSIVVYHSSDFGEIVIEGDIKHLLEEQINLPIKGNTIYVVKRPSKKKASEISMVKFNVIRQKKGSNELKFKEYICNANITTKLISELQKKLAIIGIYKYEINGEYDEATKEALTFYQNQNNLKVGALFIETLELLGVNYSTNTPLNSNQSKIKP